MSEFLEKYIDGGYSDIVSISYEHKESGSGHREKTWETVVARQGKLFFRIDVYSMMVFIGHGSGEFRMTPTQIDEREYSALASDKPIMDTPARKKHIAADKRRSELLNTLGKELDDLAPKCPRCKGEMKRRTGKRGRFWGCANFPDCTGSASFSAKATALAEKIGAL